MEKVSKVLMIGGALLALYSCLLTFAVMIIFSTEFAKITLLIASAFAGMFVTGLTMHVFSEKTQKEKISKICNLL